MKWIKQFYFMVLSFAMILQLTGCGGNQEAVTETATNSTPMVSSSVVAQVQPSVQSSSSPTQAVSEPTVEVQQKSAMESSQSVEQPSATTAQPSASEALPTASEPPASTSASEETNMNHIAIEVGGKTFSATLADNQAAKAFTAYLPMTVNMTEMNRQEKFYGLPDNLPADSTERPSTIRSGDIFCWSGNTLVLFYNTFSNSYGGYVRLGVVDDPAGLAAAVGGANVEVTWSLTE